MHMRKNKLVALFRQCTTLRALELHSDHFANPPTTSTNYVLLSHFPSLEYCRLNDSQQHKIFLPPVKGLDVSTVVVRCYQCHRYATAIYSSCVYHPEGLILMITLWKLYRSYTLHTYNAWFRIYQLEYPMRITNQYVYMYKQILIIIVQGGQ